MIPSHLKRAIEEAIVRAGGRADASWQVHPLGGGSINDAVRLDAGGSSYFVKWNSSARYPGMFDAEAAGLGLLAAAGAVRIPRVLACASAGDTAFLMLEYIRPGRPHQQSWQQFGHELAALHRHSAETFGLDHDNYIGSLPQQNTGGYQHWSDFFVERRLKPQLATAVAKGLINSAMQRQFGQLFARLNQLFPQEPPALLHGDLWSGNYLFDSQGSAVLIDPAVYYGHREMDLAMTFLFGGFDHRLYAAYHEAYPLAPGWRERIGLCNLYPLLVHVNLFGGGYVAQVRQILDRFA
ncbi:MAG: fructosamine kinase family protein [Bacteroidetes bacterium]|nr:fructosamine kinase family protein [Bacteroidota bacterium]